MVATTLHTDREGVIHITAILLNELRDAGLLTIGEEHLTDKGRDWLRQLEDLETRAIAQEWAADFVSSISAISR